MRQLFFIISIFFINCSLYSLRPATKIRNYSTAKYSAIIAISTQNYYNLRADTMDRSNHSTAKITYKLPINMQGLNLDYN